MRFLPPLVRFRKALPSGAVLRRDTLAGLPDAIASVPDGMAAGVLIGVSPVHGLYASIAGPVAGGLTSSTRLMVVTTTSAAALAAGSALSGIVPAGKPGALTLLSLIAGLVMITAGLLRAGRLTNFVSHSVMTGFLAGISVNIILGQIPSLLGATGKGQYNLVKAIDVLLHPSRIDLASLVTGITAAALIAGLGRIRLGQVSALAALILPTAGVLVFHADGVARVRDAGAVPAGVPLPALPGLGSFTWGVLTGALAVAAIVLVQGAGVAQAAPNPDGSPSSANRDFIAQGAGNLAASLLHGQPVGGSVGQTPLNIASGARSRWAGIFSGLWMLLILLVFSRLIGIIAEPTLAALLICAGIGSLHPGPIMTILRTGPTSVVALVTTFAATLFLPIAAAVGLGVALSLLLQLNREAIDLRLVELVPLKDGRLREQAPPKTLADHSVTMLDVYGSLLYAGSRTLQSLLPDPGGARRPAVVLRLRGRTQVGATFFVVADDYATRLADSGGRLFVSGVDPKLLDRFTRPGGTLASRVTAVAATSVIGESSTAAYARARAWVTQAGQDSSGGRRRHQDD